MDRDSNQLRLELAQLVNDQADTAEKRAFTDAELRVFEGRERQINELCDELHRIAIRAHKEEKVAAEL